MNGARYWYQASRGRPSSAQSKCLARPSACPCFKQRCVDQACARALAHLLERFCFWRPGSKNGCPLCRSYRRYPVAASSQQRCAGIRQPHRPQPSRRQRSTRNQTVSARNWFSESDIAPPPIKTLVLPAFIWTMLSVLRWLVENFASSRFSLIRFFSCSPVLCSPLPLRTCRAAFRPPAIYCFLQKNASPVFGQSRSVAGLSPLPDLPAESRRSTGASVWE